MKTSRNKQRGSAELGASIFGLVIMIGLYAIIGSWECSGRWKDSGMKHRFGVVAGCQVNVRDNIWLPEDRIREVDLPATKPAPDAKKPS